METRNPKNKIRKTGISFPAVLICVFIICGASGAYLAYAATNIDSLGASEKWGWNDLMGWINMKDANTVMVGSTVEGYATSSVGNILFDCATMPTSPGCADPNFSVVKDADGRLSGWAWNDTVGWISMSGTTADSQPYQVFLEQVPNQSYSYFRGFAWNDSAGWISFNCLDGRGGSSCAGNPFKTQTSVTTASPNASFISNIFDIGTATGVLNTITWKGSQPAGTSVQFQIATASTSAALTGNMATVFANSLFMSAPASPGSPVRLSPTTTITGVEVENRRYFRYKVTMSASGGIGPRIDDIIVSWSP